MTDRFNKLHHPGIVVRDIDEAQAYSESTGIGPSEIYPPLTEYAELDVPGRAGVYAMNYRICKLPNVRLQLCQPSHGPSPQRIYLDTKAEGVFHVGSKGSDADTTAAQVRRDRRKAMARGRRANRGGFTDCNSAKRGWCRLADTRHGPAGDIKHAFHRPQL